MEMGGGEGTAGGGGGRAVGGGGPERQPKAKAKAST